MHVGSLRGPVILDVITRALRARGLETTLLYGVDDMDSMDAQALLTPDAVDRYMGVPLAHIPDQAGDCHASYARHHAQTFIDVFAGLGIRPDRYYWMSDIYPTGRMDPFIRTALERAAVVRDIYRRVANVQHPEHWLPVGVVCPDCGRVGTTIASDWDGETVAVACRPDLVTWATGCGWTGRVAPFGGAAKLPWNLEWAAQWSLFGVTIEPNGKDLATAGGSRDRSNAIAREVFEREPPLNFPYEFLNIGGRKMSTSKGRGAAAHRFTEVVPPQQTRFLFVRHRPESVIEFDPEGTDAIPRLFDEFDRLGECHGGPRDQGRAARGIRLDLPLLAAGSRRGRPGRRGRLPPGIRAPGAAGAGPGRGRGRAGGSGEGQPADRFGAGRPGRAPRGRSRAGSRRTPRSGPGSRSAGTRSRGRPRRSARSSAPSSRRWRRPRTPRAGTCPRPAKGGRRRSSPVSADHALDAKAAFNALYLAFLGRPNGPRAGWLLASLEHDFVIGRLREAGAAREGQA